MSTLDQSKHEEPEKEPYRDVVYYFDFVHLSVENCLYRLPKRNLQYSRYFASIFGSPLPNPRRENHNSPLKTAGSWDKNELLGPGTNGEGETDENPIVLKGISKQAFDAFLEIVYPSSLDDDVCLSMERWIMVLDLATKWEFQQVRNWAILNLTEKVTDPVRKVHLAIKYKVSEWLFGACLDVVKRPEPLTIQEAKLLGLEFTIKLARVRETRFSMGNQVSGPNPKKTGELPYAIRPLGDEALRSRLNDELTSICK